MQKGMHRKLFSKLTFALPTGLILLALLACVLEFATACNKKESSVDPQVVRGQMLFTTNCISCHNSNPELDGSLGPAISGSPLELVQARVLRGEYPAGYNPKRPTHIMPRLPLTEANVADIVAYLNAKR